MRALIFLRSLISVLFFFPFWTGFLAALTVIHSFVWNNRRVSDRIIGNWARSSCRFFGVTVVVEGIENIPKGGCLFLFNHRSFFDIFALQGVVPSLRFGAKIELFKIPIFGTAMRRMGALPIARGNLNEVIAVYKKAEGRMRAGERFALSPEGGRNTTGQNLLPFKSGPFIFAISASAPIVPTLVFGADDVWAKGSLVPAQKKWRYKIVVRFLPPIDASQFTIENRGAAQEVTFKAMKESLDQPPAL